MNDRKGTSWGKVLIAVAATFFVLSTPCLLGGVLGLLGVVADAGQAENRQIGLQAFRISLYPLGAGLLFLVAGLLVLRSRKK